jgi:hypothetical protein
MAFTLRGFTSVSFPQQVNPLSGSRRDAALVAKSAPGTARESRTLIIAQTSRNPPTPTCSSTQSLSPSPRILHIIVKDRVVVPMWCDPNVLLHLKFVSHLHAHFMFVKRRVAVPLWCRTGRSIVVSHRPFHPQVAGKLVSDVDVGTEKCPAVPRPPQVLTSSYNTYKYQRMASHPNNVGTEKCPAVPRPPQVLTNLNV